MRDKVKLDFYDAFQCIAHQCSITCCQEWKIEVDDNTYKKWNSLSLQKAGEKNLSEYVETKDDSRVICLNSENKCPFLNKEKLCKLVLELGDETLSNTCKTFPREIHEFDNRVEYSLVSCCPEVIDMLNRQEKLTFDMNIEFRCQDTLFQIRQLLISIIQKQEYSLSESLMIGYYILQELIEGRSLNWERYRDDVTVKARLNAINQMEFSMINTFYERNELFLDLAENYRVEKLYVSYLNDIALLAEKFEDHMDEEELASELKEFMSQLQQYEQLFRNYLVAELFTNSLIPDSDFESMVMMYQWITMEYVTIRHALYLKWKTDGKPELQYSTVRDYIVIISRMTGYDQEDIEEYFENCFESVIWEWGYLALLTGN